MTMRTVSRRFLVSTIACSLGTPAVAVAAARAPAQLPQLTLGAPVATYPEGLGALAGVRELEDGRVLVSDNLGQALILWEPGAGADTLANVGEGPEEYGSPASLFPLPEGATLLLDFGNMRMTRIEADLSFSETWPLVQQGASSETAGGISSAVAAMRIVIPRQTDARGNVYYQERVGGMMARSDSAIIKRFNLASGETTDVGKIGLAETNRNESGGMTNRSMVIRSVPFSAQDAWSVTSDGRVIIARAGDYRLEWIASDGEVAVGEQVPYDPVRVRDEDREQWGARSSGGGIRMMVTANSSGGNVDRQMSMARGAPGAESDFDPDDYDWPDFKPPFPADAIRTDAHGRAWVQRHVRAGQPVLYDLFDMGGERVAQVELPEDRRLAGFGQNSVYLVRADDFDFAWLEEYESPMP